MDRAQYVHCNVHLILQVELRLTLLVSEHLLTHEPRYSVFSIFLIFELMYHYVFTNLMNYASMIRLISLDSTNTTQQNLICKYYGVINEKKKQGWTVPSKSNESTHQKAHLMVFPVLSLTHCGIGLFCFIFLPSFLLILKLLWDG